MFRHCSDLFIICSYWTKMSVQCLFPFCHLTIVNHKWCQAVFSSLSFWSAWPLYDWRVSSHKITVIPFFPQVFCQHRQILLFPPLPVRTSSPLSTALCWCTEFLFRKEKPVCSAGEFQRKRDQPSPPPSLPVLWLTRQNNRSLSIFRVCSQPVVHNCVTQCV